MPWSDSKFPEADDPLKATWVIFYWRITKRDGPGKDYMLESRQFDHLDDVSNQKEATDRFNEYVAQKREAETALVTEGRPRMTKGRTLFLAKVIEVEQITDINGDVVNG